MNLAFAMDIFAGGPGSGCRGSNCGRKAGGGEVIDLHQLNREKALERGKQRLEAHKAILRKYGFKYRGTNQVSEHIFHKKAGKGQSQGRTIFVDELGKAYEQHAQYHGTRRSWFSYTKPLNTVHPEKLEEYLKERK